MKAGSLVVGVLILVAFAHEASAQVGTSAYVRSYLLSRPTVSPYLNLLRVDGFGGAANYQTLVRPQIEARQQAQLQERQLGLVQQRLGAQQASLDALRGPRAQRVFSTGHTTRFMNTHGYFPGLQQRR